MKVEGQTVEVAMFVLRRLLEQAGDSWDGLKRRGPGKVEVEQWGRFYAVLPFFTGGVRDGREGRGKQVSACRLTEGRGHVLRTNDK